MNNSANTSFISSTSISLLYCQPSDNQTSPTLVNLQYPRTSYPSYSMNASILNNRANFDDVISRDVSKTEEFDDIAITEDLKWLKEQVINLARINSKLEYRLNEIELYSDDLYDQIQDNLL